MVQIGNKVLFVSLGNILKGVVESFDSASEMYRIKSKRKDYLVDISKIVRVIF